MDIQVFFIAGWISMRQWGRGRDPEQAGKKIALSVLLVLKHFGTDIKYFSRGRFIPLRK